MTDHFYTLSLSFFKKMISSYKISETKALQFLLVEVSKIAALSVLKLLQKWSRLLYFSTDMTDKPSLIYGGCIRITSLRCNVHYSLPGHPHHIQNADYSDMTK